MATQDKLVPIEVHSQHECMKLVFSLVIICLLFFFFLEFCIIFLNTNSYHIFIVNSPLGHLWLCSSS